MYDNKLMIRSQFKHESRIENAFKQRSSSLCTQTPSSILELIRQKRTSINKSGDVRKRNHQKIYTKPIKLCLPRIYSTNSSLDIQDRHDHTQSQQFYSRASFGTIYTQHTPNTRLSTQSVDKYSQNLNKIELDEVSEDSGDEMLEQARCTTVLAGIMKEMPKLHKQKNLQNLLPLVEFLMGNNAFFKNLPTTVVFAFLKICRIREVHKARWIYKKFDSLSSFYIILWGKVKLVNLDKKFKKISIKGQTLSQQLLFTQYNQINRREQGAKALTHCFLLEVDYKIYLKLYKQLVLKGYKSQFLTMETLIRRNYILKQGLKQRSDKM